MSPYRREIEEMDAYMRFYSDSVPTKSGSSGLEIRIQ